ncbi:PREDICTED: SH3 domain-binding protein 5-like [Amphimedon queenslandica]|uniref:SH3 domain-binding protein 5-like n=1 Tax=Amphimedon queenslandica TaxID=400682 RepID=A0A1X7VDX1_AMPQE|nr:PREDICTED: SH3 domain-binding protein 5-like [Amphimedon queenslandica]|eukprot:XP_011402485.1 PREDICTED: SH3 domain-binding protein 5-like [Amphimedon queenslandica]
MAENHLDVVEGRELEDPSRSCTPESVASTDLQPQELYGIEDEDEELDESIEQTIAVDLNTLTDTGTNVNRLEKALLEARKEYESVKRESQMKLALMKSRLHTAIEKTEPFVNMWRKAKELQREAHNATLAFERANSEYDSAKETLKIAEKSIDELKESRTDEEDEEKLSRGERDRSLSQSSATAIDEAWQETLANATLRVEKASRNKVESEIEHRRLTVEYQKIQKDCHTLETKLKRTIRKSRPYYEERHLCNKKLVGIKTKILSLQKDIDIHKEQYKKTMKHLESLSGLMHEERIRKRTYSSLDITSSEPNLISNRSATPDFSLNSRNAITPDYRRKGKESRGITNVRVPLANGQGSTGKLQASVGVSMVTAQVGERGGGGEGGVSMIDGEDVRQVVTDCLTRALGQTLLKEEDNLPQSSSENSQYIPTITVSVSYGALVPPATNDHTHSAKELVSLVLANASKQHEAELGNDTISSP